MKRSDTYIPSVTAAILTLLAAGTFAAPPRLAPEQASVTFAAATAAPPSYETTAKLLAAVTPAVVSVFPAQIVEGEDAPAALDRFFGRGEADKDKDAKENERVQGVGSGVILSPDGWIVTNSHVVHFKSGKLADAISVQLSDYRRFDAVIVGADPLTDVALLKVEAKNLPFVATRDSDTLQVGDDVYAVGNPFKLGITATRGMVSALRRSSLGMNGDGGFESFIQTDAAINPGNSGGALVDAGGRLAGINTAIYGGIGGNVGIGFAVPSNLFRSVITQLAEHGKVERGFFGWQTEDVSRADAAAAKLEAIAGAKVTQVQDGGPAAQAGLKAGDIVLKACGRPVFTRGDLRVEASMVRLGAVLEVAYQRDGQTRTASLKAGASAEDSPGAATAVFRLEALPGVDFKKGEEGLLVAGISKALAAKTGLAAGMEIVSINGTEVKTAAAAEAALRRGVNSVKTKHRSDEQTLALRLPLDEKQP
jgi:S1-C subfamily serine protease